MFNVVQNNMYLINILFSICLVIAILVFLFIIKNKNVENKKFVKPLFIIIVVVFLISLFTLKQNAPMKKIKEPFSISSSMVLKNGEIDVKKLKNNLSKKYHNRRDVKITSQLNTVNITYNYNNDFNNDRFNKIERLGIKIYAKRVINPIDLSNKIESNSSSVIKVPDEEYFAFQDLQSIFIEENEYCSYWTFDNNSFFAGFNSSSFKKGQYENIKKKQTYNYR